MTKQSVNLEDYKGSEIMKGFDNLTLSEKPQPMTVEQMENRLQDNLTKGLIDQDTFDKATEELDLLKGKAVVKGEEEKPKGEEEEEKPKGEEEEEAEKPKGEEEEEKGEEEEEKPKDE